VGRLGRQRPASKLHVVTIREGRARIAEQT